MKGQSLSNILEKYSVNNDELKLIQEWFYKLEVPKTGAVTNLLTIKDSVDVLQIDRYQNLLEENG